MPRKTPTVASASRQVLLLVVMSDNPEKGSSGPACRPSDSAPWCPVETPAQMITTNLEATANPSLTVIFKLDLSYEDPMGKIRIWLQLGPRRKAKNLGI